MQLFHGVKQNISNYLFINNKYQAIFPFKLLIKTLKNNTIMNVVTIITKKNNQKLEDGCYIVIILLFLVFEVKVDI